VALASCSSRVVDLAGPAGLGTDYVQGAVYELLKDRFLESPSGWSGGPDNIVASPLTYSYEAKPRSVEAYLADPARWPRIHGVLPAGTRVRLERITRRRYPGLEDTYEATGILESGRFSGRRVSLDWISQSVSGTRMPRVDPQELRVHTMPGRGAAQESVTIP
jgi:hypothetical protein